MKKCKYCIESESRYGCFSCNADTTKGQSCKDGICINLNAFTAQYEESKKLDAINTCEHNYTHINTDTGYSYVKYENGVRVHSFGVWTHYSLMTAMCTKCGEIFEKRINIYTKQH